MNLLIDVELIVIFDNYWWLIEFLCFPRKQYKMIYELHTMCHIQIMLKSYSRWNRSHSAYVGIFIMTMPMI